MKLLARTLAPLTLLEWGAILIYFYFSGRIAAFLHPMFRPLVLVTGALLVITAASVAFFPQEECAHAHADGSTHEHDVFTAKSLLAFLILFLPVALATVISPDDYGATLIKNRGLVEDIRGLPTFASRAPSPEIPVLPNESLVRARQSEEVHQSISAAANALSERTPASAIEDSLPSTDGTYVKQEGDATVTYQNEFLKPNREGNISAQVTDLLYAAQEPESRKDFEGKRVELLGQFVGGKKAARATSNGFHLMRLVMVCCAADMMPAAVKIESQLGPNQLKEMGWVKVSGIVHFRPREKQAGQKDGVDYGDFPEPVIVADKVAAVKPPREKYIY